MNNEWYEFSSEKERESKKIKIKIKSSMIDWTTKHTTTTVRNQKNYFSPGTEGVHNVLVLDDLIFS